MHGKKTLKNAIISHSKMHLPVGFLHFATQRPKTLHKQSKKRQEKHPNELKVGAVIQENK